MKRACSNQCLFTLVSLVPLMAFIKAPKVFITCSCSCPSNHGCFITLVNNPFSAQPPPSPPSHPRVACARRPSPESASEPPPAPRASPATASPRTAAAAPGPTAKRSAAREARRGPRALSNRATGAPTRVVSLVYETGETPPKPVGFPRTFKTGEPPQNQ